MRCGSASRTRAKRAEPVPTITARTCSPGPRARTGCRPADRARRRRRRPGGIRSAGRGGTAAARAGRPPPRAERAAREDQALTARSWCSRRWSSHGDVGAGPPLHRGLVEFLLAEVNRISGLRRGRRAGGRGPRADGAGLLRAGARVRLDARAVRRADGGPGAAVPGDARPRGARGVMTAVPGLLAHAAVRRATRPLAGGRSVAACVTRLAEPGVVTGASGVLSPLAGHGVLTTPLAAWSTLASTPATAAGQALARSLTRLDARILATAAADGAASPGSSRRPGRRTDPVRPAPTGSSLPAPAPTQPLSSINKRSYAPVRPEDSDVAPQGSGVDPMARESTGVAGPPEQKRAPHEPSAPGPRPRTAAPSPGPQDSHVTAKGKPLPDADAASRMPSPDAPDGGVGGLAELLQRYERTPSTSPAPPRARRWPPSAQSGRTPSPRSKPHLPPNPPSA